MTLPTPEQVAEQIVDAWETAEGESLRDGHRYTLGRLIAEALRTRDAAVLAEAEWRVTARAGYGLQSVWAIRALARELEGE